MPVRAPSNRNPSSTDSRISPIPKSPMTATMKSKPFMSSVKPNVIRSWPVTMSSPTAARMNPTRIETSDFSGLPPPSPTKLENVKSWMAKNSGGPNFNAISARTGAKKRDEHDREEGPHERRRERRRQRLPALAPPGHRVPVERGRHRPGLAGNVEQHGGDGPAEQRAPVERREQDDGRGRRHRERERQQDGDAVGAPQTRQHADDGPEQDAQHGDEQVEGRDGDVEAEEEVLESHGSESEPALRAAPSASAPGTTARRRRKSRPGRPRPGPRRVASRGGRSSACRTRVERGGHVEAEARVGPAGRSAPRAGRRRQDLRAPAGASRAVTNGLRRAPRQGLHEDAPAQHEQEKDGQPERKEPALRSIRSPTRCRAGGRRRGRRPPAA